MFKVSFKDDSKKVQVFNNRATIVTLVGHMSFPTKLWSVFPDTIANWMWQHPTVDASWSVHNTHWGTEVIRLEVSGKSVCLEEDTFNPIIGERIAESRAKIKLYTFVCTLLNKLIDCYRSFLLGKDGTIRGYDSKGQSLCAVYDKYQGLLIKESYHLCKLLEES